MIEWASIEIAQTKMGLKALLNQAGHAIHFARMSARIRKHPGRLPTAPQEQEGVQLKNQTHHSIYLERTSNATTPEETHHLVTICITELFIVSHSGEKRCDAFLLTHITHG